MAGDFVDSTVLFRFAVITDTHLNQGEDECNSPFEVNRLANQRMRYVLADLNERELDFVIHLGDLVHPVPAVENLYNRAAKEFHEQVAGLKHPLHFIPGNHDVGDKPNPWAPAGTVTKAFLDLYAQHFGPGYFAFEHKGCHFLFINAQVINTGLAEEQQQRIWLEQYLETHSRERLFLSTHYPPYLNTVDEDEHYDNIAIPGRQWLLDLLERYEVEVLFAGHVHHFWYYRHARTDCYLLPSTAFVRQDYSEMFRSDIAEGFEGGRNDYPKLGYFLVDVHSDGHACRPVRTFGRCLSTTQPPLRPIPRVVGVLPRENINGRLGFDLRHDWFETTEIPPTGGLDEFERKVVRNDYPLLAFLDTGINALRIPVRDIHEPNRRARVKLLSELGLRFTLFSFGIPSTTLLEEVEACNGCLAGWEIAGHMGDLADIVDAIAQLVPMHNFQFAFSKMLSKAEVESSGEKYYHMINHGFSAGDDSTLRELATIGVFERAVFRIAPTMALLPETQAIAKLAAQWDLQPTLHLRLGTANPGQARLDPHWTATRLAEAIFVGLGQPNMRMFADAFMDIDRGYFMRQGVLDRLCNPRLAYHVVRHLFASLNRPEFAKGTVESIDAAGLRVLVANGECLAALALPGDLKLAAKTLYDAHPATSWHRVNLETGEIVAQLDQAIDNATVAVPELFVASKV